MKTWRLILIAAVASTVAFAQVNVQAGGKTVKVGAGGGVEVQKNGKTVKVNAGGTKVKVDGADEEADDDADDDAEAADVNVNAGGTAVDVKSGSKNVKVKTGGGTVTVTGSNGKTVSVQPGAADGKWFVDGQGRTESHTCAANEDVEVTGQGHVLTLNGPCRSIVVSGQGSVVTTDVAGSINVSGMGNKVRWKAALTGKKPKVSSSGMDNSISQQKK